MRRLWLTIVLTVVLAAGGFANALAAQACPMQSAPAQMAAHDCCPDGAGKQDDSQGQDHQKSMAGCVLGQSCRTAPAIAPSLAPVALPTAAIKMSQPRLGVLAALGLTSMEFWRPPRTA